MIDVVAFQAAQRRVTEGVRGALADDPVRVTADARRPDRARAAWSRWAAAMTVLHELAAQISHAMAIAPAPRRAGIEARGRGPLACPTRFVEGPVGR